MGVVGKFPVEKSLFEAIFKSSFEAIALIDRQNRFVKVNTLACKLLNSTQEKLIEKSIFDYITPESKEQMTSNSVHQEEKKIKEVQISSANGKIKTLEYQIINNLSPNYKLLVLRDITPLKLAEVELHRQHQRVKLFSEVTLKISQALQLQEILQTAVTEVQRILKADRVLIYQVFDNGTGMAISEAILPDYPSILAINFPEEVFPTDYQKLYAAGRIQAITNVNDSKRNLSECLIDFLKEWKIKSKLVVPILQNLKSHIHEEQGSNQLWGLLIAHQCQTTRQWQDFELELMQQLAAQIGIALSQAELRENLEGLVTERTAKLRQANTHLKAALRERKEAEAALRRSEETLRLIANGLPVLIAYVDQKQRYSFNNEAYNTWLGLSPHKIYGRHLQEVHGQEEYQKIRKSVEMVLSGQVVSYEEDIILQDGCVHSVTVNYIPHIDEQENNIVKGFFALTSDISERKAIERMKDEFISIVSHELRTPLTSIHSSLKILATGKLGNLSDKGERMLTIADEQTDRLVRLVNNVLDLQSIQSGKVKMNKRATQAMDLMLEAAKTMQTMAQQQGIKLFTETVSFLVWADHDYIVQTLTNLLSNAIKFSPSQSEVWLSAKIEYLDNQIEEQKLTPYVIFEVKDQGQGIPTNQLENIFERFQQVDSSDSRKKGGTGLGLTICRQIIEEHEGKIWVESCVGKGSSFYFTLPLFTEKGG